MKNKLAIFILSFVCLTCFTIVAKAEPADGPPTPIDGGASLLVGAAVVYGVKKYKDRKKDQQPIK
jgi:hypothetical protein